MRYGETAVRALVVLWGFALCANAAGHGNESGPLKVTLTAYESGTSDGYYQYQLIWGMTGENHASYSPTHLQSSPDNIGPWIDYKVVSGHSGDLFPAPLGVFHRASLCHRFTCFIRAISNKIWIPRQACASVGGRFAW